MANPENLNKRKSFVENDPRINRKGLPVRFRNLDKSLRRVMGERVAMGDTEMVALDAMLHVLRELGLEGDLRAIDMILERLYGKVKSTDPPPVINVNMPSISIKYRNE